MSVSPSAGGRWLLMLRRIFGVSSPCVKLASLKLPQETIDSLNQLFSGVVSRLLSTNHLLN